MHLSIGGCRLIHPPYDKERRDFTIRGRSNEMKNKVTVTIAQREYTLISDEGEAYVEKVASYVSGQIQETMRTAGVSAYLSSP